MTKKIVQLKAMRNVHTQGHGGEDFHGVDEATSPGDVDFFALYIGQPGSFVHMRDFGVGAFDVDEAIKCAQDVATALGMDLDKQQVHNVCDQRVWAPAKGKLRTLSAPAATKVSALLVEQRVNYSVEFDGEAATLMFNPEHFFKIWGQVKDLGL